MREGLHFGRLRPACPVCGLVAFEDPKVATGVLVSHGDDLLLVRRNHDPHLGQWSFPSGFVDRGEEVEAAALREVREETGLEAAIDGLLGVFSRAGEAVIFIAYAGHPTGGKLAPGEEAFEAAFFPIASLPRLAFEHDADIVRRWLQRRQEVTS